MLYGGVLHSNQGIWLIKYLIYLVRTCQFMTNCHETKHSLLKGKLIIAHPNCHSEEKTTDKPWPKQTQFDFQELKSHNYCLLLPIIFPSQQWRYLIGKINTETRRCLTHRLTCALEINSASNAPWFWLVLILILTWQQPIVMWWWPCWQNGSNSHFSELLLFHYNTRDPAETLPPLC